MHFNFDFTLVQVLWTLTFAALLVLLVVLLGRDRVSRFPWFTTSITLVAVRMLIGRLLFHRLAQVVAGEIFLPLAALAAIVSLLVAVEIARSAFAGAGRRAWLVATVVLLAAAGLTVALWGPWPPFKTLFAASTIAVLRTTELVAQKVDLLASLLTVEVGLLVAIFGRRFKAGWHSHTQQISIGLAMVSLTQLTIRACVQHVAMHTEIHNQTEYKRVVDLVTSLNNANSVVFLSALLWWIACLWINEPGTENPATGNETQEPVSN